MNIIDFDSIQNYINQGDELLSKIGSLSDINIIETYLNYKQSEDKRITKVFGESC